MLLLAMCTGVAARQPIEKPHLHGIFLDITTTTATWSEGMWATDLQSMVDIGLEFVVLHHVAAGSATISEACPLGKYSTLFPVDAPCFSQIGNTNASGGTVGGKAGNTAAMMPLATKRGGMAAKLQSWRQSSNGGRDG